MQNKRLISYRRGINKQLGVTVQSPTPYYPTIHADIALNNRIEAEFKVHAHHKQKEARAREAHEISRAQPFAGANIVRCKTQAYSKILPATALQPVLVIPQNLSRVFLAIIAAKSNTSVVGVSFNNPGRTVSFQFQALIFNPGDQQIFNSSVIPIDDIYVEGPTPGDYITIYEGISIGDLT